MTKMLYLVRHGQTMFNLRRKIQGWCDSPLTELGIEQARAARRNLEEMQARFGAIDHVYCSTSGRARDTAAVLSEVPATAVADLREWCFGKLEGETVDLLPEYGEWDRLFCQFGGESRIEARERVAAAIDSAMRPSSNKSVLVVSHGASCMEFLQLWKGRARAELPEFPRNCMVLRFTVELAAEAGDSGRAPGSPVYSLEEVAPAEV